MVRNPQAEAASVLGGAFDVRVLEPSPPPSNEPPYFADDPLAGGEVLPIDRPGTKTWQAVCDDRGDDELRRWCQRRWLVPAALQPLPAGFISTRESLQRLAEHVLAPCRYRATGKIGLRYTFAGFGTPFFGRDRQVRVEGGVLFEGDRRHELTTLAEAARFVGIEPGAPAEVYRPSTPADLSASLIVDAESAEALGDWFGFCTRVLEQLRDEAGPADRPGRVQLWPEHFDVAVDLGPDGGRANFGGSPGDEGHPSPYLYVGPWEPRLGTFWNAPFGAALGYEDLVAGADPLAFLRRGRDLLAAG